MQVEQKFFVGIQDIGLNNEISNKAVLEALTNVSNVHGNLIHDSISKKEAAHIKWVVLNWKLEVYKRPKLCETILAKTWVQEHSKIYVNRDYEVLNEKGELAAKATSKWIAVDTETGRIKKLNTEFVNHYKPEAEHKNFPGYEVCPEDDGEFINPVSKVKFKICKSMIDCNNHVHNTSYLDIAMEVLPDGLDKTNFENLEITYKKEIKPDEVVVAEYFQKNDKNYIIIKDEGERELHSVIFLY